MLSNYLKIAVRNLWRHRGYAFINVTGLAVGMACCLLIVLYVRDELSYDTFHENADRVARLVRTRSAYTAAPMGPALAAEMPGVRHATRLQVYEDVLVRTVERERTGERADGEGRREEREGGREEGEGGREERRFVESIVAADPNFFETFSFELIRGDRTTALARPDAIVLSESAARKYFGDADPIGQTLILEDDEPFVLTVTGVLADIPSNAHFRFDLLASFALVEQTSTRLENWSTNWLFTYLLFEDGGPTGKSGIRERAQQLTAQLPAFFERHTGQPRSDIRVQPLLDIHLRSSGLELDIAPQGSAQYLMIFAAVALLVLLIACINFMNLATARASMRSREVGLRKVMGAKRKQLFVQFMGESLVLAFVAMFLAIGLVLLALPAFGAVTGKHLTLLSGGGGFLLAALGGLTLLVGLIAGSYPALFLSGLRAIDSMKGTAGSLAATGGASARGGFLRKGLVVFQFAVSTFLIVGTLVVVKQLDYVRNARLGFSKEQVVVLPVGSALDGETGVGYQTAKAELVRDPRVLGVSASGNVPGRDVSDFLYRPEGLTGTTDDLPGWDTYFIDEDFVGTLELEVVAGRGFSRELDGEPGQVGAGRAESSDDAAPGGSHVSFLLNESAVAAAVERAGEAWREPVGKQLEFYLPGAEGWQVFRSGTVVGVVADFHYRSMREAVGPLVLQVFPDAFGSLLVKISTDDVAGTLAFLEDRWEALGVEAPFDYYFLDASFDRLYAADTRLGTLFGYLAGLTIVIACMGLFGLAAFMTERRTKEIGIRKTLGATVSSIALLLSREYVRLVAVAFVIAVPIAYVAMNRWLGGFAYQTEITAAVFLAAAVVVLAIALATVSWQSIRAATADPVRALRTE